jgi:hypothetical protein
MTSRFSARLSAAEEKIGGGLSHPERLYFIKGYPADGAEALLRTNGRDLTKPHRIVAFIPVADAKPVAAPLVEITDELGRGVP